YCSILAENIGAGAIVLIGGQARSGKSTFAHVLRDAILARGRRALVLSVDRWLRSETERKNGVLGRFDLEALQALIDNLRHGSRSPEILTLPGYHKLRRERINAVETVRVGGSDVILVEGAVSLALEVANEAEVHRFHVEIDEPARRQRVLHEYRLRGYHESEALQLYRSRQDDEYQVIEGLAGNARRVLPAAVFAESRS